jgi:signal transduction histidine kinase
MLSVQLTQAERFSSLGRLAAQVAHEIRNPLGAVRLKAENALSGDRDRQNEALKFILRQVERIETQVSSLLALTQPITLSMQIVDFPAWLSTATSSHDEQARVKHVKLCIDLSPLLDNLDKAMAHYLRLDPDQLNRALDNLVLNALRHVPHGGTVTVSARQVALYGETWLRIEVADDGPGVPVAERESIFEPFVTGRPDGSGLGLAVVREIASAHGGRAFLGDAEQGACFIVEVPWQTSL